MRPFPLFLKNRYIKNSAWPILETVIPPVFMLGAVPVFIKFLGAERYGIWLLVNSIATFANFLNIGFGDANIKFVSKYRAVGDTTRIADVVHTLYSLSLYALLVGFLLGILSAGILGEISGILPSANSLKPYRVLLVLGFFVFSLKIVEQSFLAVFKGFERYDISSKLGILSKSLVILVNIFLAYITKSLPTIFLSSVIILLLMNVVYFLLINSKFVRFSCFPKINSEIFKEIKGFSLWSFAQGIIGILSTQMDKFVVAKIAGVTTLAYYSIAQMVVNQLHAIFASAAGFVFPIVSKKVELNHSVEGIYYKLQLFIITLGTVCVAGIFFFREFIFCTWLGTQTYLQIIKFLEFFLLAEYFLLTTVVAYYYMNAGGHIKLNTYIMGSSTLLQIGLMYVFFNAHGVLGLAFGKSLATVVAAGVSILFIYSRILKDSRYLSSLVFTFSPAVFFVVAYWFKFIDSLFFLIPFLCFMTLSFYLYVRRKVGAILSPSC